MQKKRKKIFQKRKCHSTVLLKFFQISNNYFSFHIHFKSQKGGCPAGWLGMFFLSPEDGNCFRGQLQLCGLILKVTMSHLKSLKFSSSKFLIMHTFSIGKHATRKNNGTPKHIERRNAIITPGLKIIFGLLISAGLEIKKII